MKSILKNLPFYFLLSTSFWLIFLFLTNRHYIYTWDILEEWFATQGLVYYKDFASFHFFLGKMLFIPFRPLTNWNLEIDPFIGLALGIGSLIVLYSFGKHFLSSKATCITLVFFALFFWYVATGILYYDEILTGFLLSILLLFLFHLNQKKIIKPNKAFILGLLTALTELTGQIVTLTLIITTLYIVYIIIKRKKDNYNLLKLLFYFILGASIPFVIIAGYFIHLGAFNEFFFNNVTYYIFRYSALETSLLSLPFDQLIIYYIPLFIGILILVLGQKKNILHINYIFFLLLGLSSIPFIVFSMYHPHHLSYALPILAILAGMVFDYAVRINKKAVIIFILGTSVFVVYSILTIIPWHISRIIFPPNFKITNDLYPDDNNSLSKTIEWLKNQTPPDAKIMVVGTPLIFNKSGRLPASRPSVGVPHTWEPFLEIKKEIQAAPPSYWIIDRQYTKRLIEAYNEKKMVDFLDEELAGCYQKQVEYEKWQIWKRICQ